MPSTSPPTLPLTAIQLREPFGLILVLHSLHMEWRSLPSGRHGINEPKCLPTLNTVQKTRTKEPLLQFKWIQYPAVVPDFLSLRCLV